MAKGIMWDRKFIPETMINLMTIKTINQFAREAIIHSKQRFEALVTKMCRKAAILPGQLLSTKLYGPIADHMGADGVAHIKCKVGFWFLQTNGPTYAREFHTYCINVEDEINHLTEINPGDPLIPLLRIELQKVQHFAGLLMEPSGVIPLI